MRGERHQATKEALFYHQIDKGVQCDLCPHYCHMGDGQYGICLSRVNRGGKLISEVYGLPCALNIDPIEKKPLFHFLPASQCLSIATTGCNLSCKNCQNYTISQDKVNEAASEVMLPQKVVETALDEQCPSIAYTYTEPLTFYEYTKDISILAHQNNIRNVIVSAGYINSQPLEELIPYIDAANIDLKSFDNDLYKRLNGATLQPVLDTLKMLLNKGVWLEITNLLIPTLNDSDEMLRNMCTWFVDNGFADCPLHFSRFFPMYRLENIPVTPLQTLLKAYDIAKDCGMKYVYLGNVSEVEGDNTYCPKCNTLLIHRRGFTVLANQLVDGHCCHCGEKIAGVWR